MTPRLVLIVTHPMTARHLMAGQLAYLRERGFDTTLISSPGADLDLVAVREGVDVLPIPMPREIAPLRDLRAVFRLYLALRRLRPHIVHASTPKAGLLGMLAAFLARVPVRVYGLRGLRLETASGLKRRILYLTERLAAACAHRVLCVSPSLQQRVIEMRLIPPWKLRVLGSGGSNGIDAGRTSTPEESVALALQMGIAEGTRTVGFVGRFTRDKGIEDLLWAFEQVSQGRPECRLLLVGGFEPGDALPEPVERRIRDNPRILCPGFVADATPYYSLMQVLAFPSYREGLPNVPLEAAAASLPVVGYRATGTVDAVQDGQTGTLVPVGDRTGLADAIARYLDEPELRALHGRAARERVLRLFTRDRVWDDLHQEYLSLLGAPLGGRPSFYARHLKRWLDSGLAVTGLILLAPLLIVLAVAVRLALGVPVFFTQLRPGLRGRPFRIYKFRTMLDLHGTDGQTLPDAARITRFGGLLRRLSLDEIPELFNVLKGDLSLVGPRPLLMEYLPLYSPRQARRHDVRPGITGWAQVNGRNALSWEQKFDHDLWYVENLSLALDLRILVRTGLQVLRREGIHAEGHATMPRFRGSPR